MNSRIVVLCLFVLLWAVDGLAGPNPTVDESGLIAYFNFENDTDSAIVCANNSSLSAVSSTQVEHVPGISGLAVNLEGSYRIMIPCTIVDPCLRRLTISAWVKPSAANRSARYSEILRKEDGDNRILLSFQENMTQISLGLNSGQYFECDAEIAPEEVLDGSWHFVAATFDGKELSVYLDGTRIGRKKAQSEFLHTAVSMNAALGNPWGIDPQKYDQREQPNATRTQNLSVRKDAPAYIGSSSGTSEFYQGGLDELRFYARALSEPEIAQQYSAVDLKRFDVISKESLDKLYVKLPAFVDTIVAVRRNLAQTESDGNVSSAVKAALFRRLRVDFPEECVRFTRLFGASPLNYSLPSREQLLFLADALYKEYTEYLPLTPAQWSVLSEKQKAKWNRVIEVKKRCEELKSQGANADVQQLFEVVLEMRLGTSERPVQRESVAPRRDPATPPVVDLTEAEARAKIEFDWLHQCDGKPTVEASLNHVNWARAMADRIEKQYPGKVDFGQRRKALDDLEQKLKVLDPGALNQDLYFAVRTVKREIQFANPVLDFDSILFVDGPYPEGSEWRHETRHRLGYMGGPGGRLMVLKGLSPAGKQTKLMPQEPLSGAFWRPDLSFDGKKVLFCFMPHNEKAFHIYEINIDGTGLRQLTGGQFDDLDPIYLQDGKHIMFLTTRGYLYVRCMPPTNAYVMARMELGSRDVYIVSRNGEPEYTPSVMSDGRVIYTRWEYTDKPLWRAQSLWTMNPDGTQVQTFWGNQSVWPDLLKDARSIPNSERIMFTGSAHHQWFAGSVGIIDPRKGFNYPDGLTKVTADVSWPESGNGPVNPIESPRYHRSGAYPAYYSPYPLSEEDFLVSAQRGDKFVLLLMNVEGDRELIWEGVYNTFHAQPIRSRPAPPPYIDRVNWPDRASRNNPGTGIIYSNNVYEGMPDEARGKAKFLRILSIEHKTYTLWDQRPYISTGPEVSMVQSEGVKRILGTVPVEDDGSVSFVAPSGIALHFQLLDQNQRALQTMRSFTGVQPGETRGCLGCHESKVRTPVSLKTGKALRRAPSPITPVPWSDNSVSYERYVQPTLDKYCGKCHQDPENDAYKAINMTFRPGFLSFNEPYVTLTGRPMWASPQVDASQIPGFGWADTIRVEGYSTVDPKAYATVPPMTKLSYKSRLVERMASGAHHNVVVDPISLLRVICWVDAMCPYKGAEEVRAIEDPVFSGSEWLSVKPRIKTAPIVQRPGPFDAFDTEEDSAYRCPVPEEINKLPPGMGPQSK